MKEFSKSDLERLDNFGNKPILRIFMSSDEIKFCNRCVKLGLMQKGKSPERNGTIQYYIP